MPAAATEPQHPLGRATPSASEPVVERRLSCMGTELLLRVAAPDRAAALAASEEAVRALVAAEARLSTWTSASELAQLNATPVGVERPLSPELARELEAAERWFRDTRGAFDPGVGALVRVWGLRTGGASPSPSAVAAARDGGGFAGLELRGETAVRRRAGLVVEEGAFGKGAGLECALTALAGTDASWALLDLGGQLALYVPHVAGTGASEVPEELWGEIAVADPEQRSKTVARLRVRHGSLATSGNSERGIVVDGARRSHLLDPRTGAPAPDFGSLTVWTASPLDADCLSTGLYVMGPEAALLWAAEREGVEVLVAEATPDGVRLRATAGLAALLDLPAGAPPVRVAPAPPRD